MDVVLIRPRPAGGGGRASATARWTLRWRCPSRRPPSGSSPRWTACGRTASRRARRPARATTAAALAHGTAIDIDLEIEPRLRELDFGQWEGREWTSIDRADLDHWAANLMAARPHGGESAAQVMARVVDWAGSLPADAGGCLWVVTHAGPIRMLAAHWLGLPLARTLAWELGFGATRRLHRRKAEGSGARLGWWNFGCRTSWRTRTRMGAARALFLRYRDPSRSGPRLAPRAGRRG